MPYWEYWQWEFRYLAMALGFVLCTVVALMFPHPLIEKSLPMVAAIFLAGVSLAIAGAILEVRHCFKEKRHIIQEDFPSKVLFKCAKEALSLRGKSMIAFSLALAILCLPVAFTDMRSLAGFILGVFLALLGLSDFMRAVVNEYVSRNPKAF